MIRSGLPPLQPQKPDRQGAAWFVRACARAVLSTLACIVAALLLGFVPAKLSADVHALPSDEVDVVGADRIVITRYEDTFSDIARGQNLGYVDMIIANPGVDPWLPGTGKVVALPSRFVLPNAARNGMVINIAEYRLYYFFRSAEREYVATFPIGIGRQDWETPVGETHIVSKMVRPTWYPPASVRAEHAAEGDPLPAVVAPGPDNPLGQYAIRLAMPGYLIHGTNRPAGIGMRVTHGCIRMYPEDIDWLFSRIAVNTPVQVINQPYKLGWAEDGLYLEVHPPLESASADNARDMTPITEQYVKLTVTHTADIDWDLVTEVFERQSGRPVKIGGRSESIERLADNDPGPQ